MPGPAYRQRETNDVLRVLDLFSGIGGFSLGLERTGGFKTVAFCESDPYCRRVLAKHWPDVPCHEDIRELTGDAIGPVDVITGGYPCQPFSVAGKRRGEKDDRHLWPEMRRLVAELRPNWVLGENVNGHINMGLDEVLFDLETELYTARTFALPAVGLDAWHIRSRLWIVAHAYSRGRAQQVCEFGLQGAPLAGNDGASWSLAGEGAGLWRGRRTQPGVCRVADGVPNGLDRRRALGNAVVPQVVEVIGRAILTAERDTQ